MSHNPVFKSLSLGFTPDPYLSIDKWADTFRQLPRGASAEAGQYNTARMPYLREIMEELSPQSPTQQVKVIKGTQLGFTEVGNNVAMYYMDIVPTSQLMIMPTESLTKDHSNRKLTPSLRAMPYLAKKIGGGKTKDDIGGTFEKAYPGGMLKLAWAGSPANFRSLSCRVVILDDVDGFPSDVDGEGDPLDLAKKRTDSFGILRKIYINSTPTVAGKSNIETEFESSDQRHYYMPCPHCKKEICFEEENFRFEYDKETYALTSDVVYICPECTSTIEEYHKSKMLAKGKWIPHKQGHIHRGYRLPAYYSPLGFLTWVEIFREFLEAKALMSKKDVRKMKTWKNTRAAVVWEESYEKVEIEDFESKKEFYTAQVPDGVLMLSFGADTQDDRIECEIIGWGEAEQSWSIAYKIFHGDTSKPAVWARFDEFLLKTWTHENGGLMRVYCGGLDTQGHRAKQAYAFCKNKFYRRVFAFKGHKSIDAPISPRTSSRNNKGHIPLYMIGVNAAKDVVYSHITTQEIGAGYMHFPQDAEYNKEYFDQLTAEHREDDGRWVKHRARNEALDVRVYGYASLLVAGVDLEVLAHNGPLMFSEKSRIRKKQKKPTNYLEEF